MNVAMDEWCGDWFGEDYYNNSPNRNPKGPLMGEFRVVRGGYFALYRKGVRTSVRFKHQPYSGFRDLGFRLAFPK